VPCLVRGRGLGARLASGYQQALVITRGEEPLELGSAEHAVTAQRREAGRLAPDPRRASPVDADLPAPDLVGQEFGDRERLADGQAGNTRGQLPNADLTAQQHRNTPT
jgi:hypothetical protein